MAVPTTDFYGLERLLDDDERAMLLGINTLIVGRDITGIGAFV